MKNPPLKNLLYRELVLASSGLKLAGVMAAIVMVICILLQLSLDYGNLGNLPPVFSFMAENVPMIIVFLPSFVLMIASEVTLTGTLEDMKPKWSKYRLSLPTSPLRFVTAKYLMRMISFLASGFVYAVLMLILYLAGNENISASTIKISMVLFMAFELMNLVR